MRAKAAITAEAPAKSTAAYRRAETETIRHTEDKGNQEQGLAQRPPQREEQDHERCPEQDDPVGAGERGVGITTEWEHKPEGKEFRIEGIVGVVVVRIEICESPVLHPPGDKWRMVLEVVNAEMRPGKHRPREHRDGRNGNEHKC